MPLGGTIPLVVAGLSLVMVRRRLPEVAVCLLLYLIDLLMFTNLYIIHDYYCYANNIFLVIAVGLAIVAMSEVGRPARRWALAGTVLLLGSMVVEYHQTFQPIQARDQSSMKTLGTAIHDRTRPDDVIVVLGFDWSSEVPYYSRRRLLCLANWVTEAGRMDTVPRHPRPLSNRRGRHRPVGGEANLPRRADSRACDYRGSSANPRQSTLRTSSCYEPTGRIRHPDRPIRKWATNYDATSR